MKITNKFGLPEPIYNALTHDDYSRGDSNRSVTQLIDAPRIRILRQEFDYEMDASDMAWLVLGKSMHHWFEVHTRPNGAYTPEERLFAEVDGWSISGAIDIQYDNAGSVTLTDYKCTSVWSVIFGKVEWERQLNFYAWLTEYNGNKPVRGLQVCAILRDWSQRKVGSADYPAAPIVMIDIPLWSHEKRDEFVRERVRRHQEAEFTRIIGDELPYCTDEERWLKPGQLAVKKKGNKRALKLYDPQDEALAQEHVAKHPDLKLEIERRHGEATRCAFNYCGVAQHCTQYQEELKRERDGTEQPPE